MAQTANGLRLTFGISRVEELDDGTCRVEGVAATEQRADDGLVITADAMREALPAYMESPALRSMHQPIAAGIVEHAEVGDDGRTRIVARVVDPVEAMKVREQVYRSFSIRGGILKRDPSDTTKVTRFKWRETSLVDLPGDPGVGKFTVIRAAVDPDEPNDSDLERGELAPAPHPEGASRALESTMPKTTPPAGGAAATATEEPVTEAARAAEPPAVVTDPPAPDAVARAGSDLSARIVAACQACIAALVACAQVCAEAACSYESFAWLCQDCMNFCARCARVCISCIEACGGDSAMRAALGGDLERAMTTGAEAIRAAGEKRKAGEIQRAADDLMARCLAACQACVAACANCARVCLEAAVGEPSNLAWWAAECVSTCMTSSQSCQSCAQACQGDDAMRASVEGDVKRNRAAVSAFGPEAEVERKGAKYSKATRAALARAHTAIQAADSEMADMKYDDEKNAADEDAERAASLEADVSRVSGELAAATAEVERAKAAATAAQAELETARAGLSTLTTERDGAKGDVARLSTEKDAAIARAAAAEAQVATFETKAGELQALLETKGVLRAIPVSKENDTGVQRTVDAPPAGPDHEERMAKDSVYRAAQELDAVKRAQKAPFRITT